MMALATLYLASEKAIQLLEEVDWREEITTALPGATYRLSRE